MQHTIKTVNFYRDNLASIAEKQRKKVYNSKAWKILSIIYKSDHPFCEICAAEGKITDGEDLHHIVYINEDPSKAYDESNLIHLCKRHHGLVHTGEITREELQRIKEN